MTALAIKSDFMDWYDFMFDRPSPECNTLLRYASGGMNRPDMLSFLRQKGFLVPRYGEVIHVVNQILEEDYSFRLSADSKDYSFQPSAIHKTILESTIHVVVYTDINSHRGENKIKLNGFDAVNLHPNVFCTQFIPSASGDNGESFRFLKVGSKSWRLKYTSADDWRSNVGNVNIEMVEESHSFSRFSIPPGITEPMYAIDFVFDQGSETYYAVDFNIAPGLGPLRYAFRATEIVSLLRDWFEENQNW